MKRQKQREVNRLTVTLYNYIQSELIKQGLNEYVNGKGELVFFNEEVQFMTKIFTYDEDVSSIVDKLFTGLKLNDPVYDEHFKKGFLYRFVNRRIGRQTIEAFRLQLMATFITNQRYVNHIYSDLDQYLHNVQTAENSNKQRNQQKTDGTAMTDNRSAFANLPQNNVNLDVDSPVMASANDNTISRNKNETVQETSGLNDGESTSSTRAYAIDELFKTNGLEERIYKEFDKRCFMQIW